MHVEVITDDPFNNVTENIFAKIGANLHRRPDHPICIIKEAIYSFFDERHPGVFSKLDDLHPVVTAASVSPSLLFPNGMLKIALSVNAVWYSMWYALQCSLLLRNSAGMPGLYPTAQHKSCSPLNEKLQGPKRIPLQGDEWSAQKQLCAMQNFEEVLVPADHVSRSCNDTYYIDKETVLRCHTSAHQAETLRKGERAFLVTGLLQL